jgi:hypothetical protein
MGGEAMAMVVVVLARHSGELALDARSASQLAELGVTHVAIAGDDHTEVAVLEGWAFDAEVSGTQAAEVIAGASPHRTLKPVLQTLISRVSIQREGGARTTSNA